MEAEEMTEMPVIKPSTSKLKRVADLKKADKKVTSAGTKAVTVKQKAKDDSSEKEVQSKRESKSVPVLTTYNINVKDMICSIDGRLGHRNYSVKVLGKNVANIGVCTLSDYNEVRSLLEDQKVEFYTYTPKGLRPYSVVIEGLPCTFEPDEIVEYLNGLQINIRVISVVRLGSDKWVLKMSRDSDVRKFYEVRFILRCRVNIRKFERRGITQCFNCQRYGHVSSNCRMPYRCVKCAGSHGPGKCLVPRKRDNVQETLVTDPVTGQVTKAVGLPVKCANCGVEGHAASSSDCPRRAELLRKLEARKVGGGDSRTRGVPVNRSVISKGVSYAAAAMSSSNGEGRKGVSRSFGLAASVGAGLSMEGAMARYDVIDKDCSRLFGGGFLQCLERIGRFSGEYQTLDNDGDRTRALFGMLMTLRHDG